MIYAAEEFGAMFWEAEPLIQAHAEEVGLTEQPLPFEPALEMYGALEKAGLMRWYTVRTGEGISMPASCKAAYRQEFSLSMMRLPPWHMTCQEIICIISSNMKFTGTISLWITLTTAPARF